MGCGETGTPGVGAVPGTSHCVADLSDGYPRNATIPTGLLLARVMT